jgi:HK97 family phage prohead protease
MDIRSITEHEVKILPVAFKAAPDRQRTFRFKISDATSDYDNDIVDPKGWDLTNFKKTGGPVMFGHDYSSLPIAKDVGISVEADGLYGYPQFPAPGIHPFADTVYELIQGGFLNAASVGFKPKTYLYNEERKGYDIAEALLLEYSIVPIGANPSALIQRAKAAGVNIIPLEKWCEQYLDETYGTKGGVWMPRFQVEEVFKFMNQAKAVTVPDGVISEQKEAEKEVGAESGTCPSCGHTPALELDIEEASTLELADDPIIIDAASVNEAIASAVRTGLAEVITHQVRERIDYARGRVI